MECSLETLLKYEQPTKYIVASEEYSDEYPIPVLTAGKSFILGYTNEENGICRASISPVIIYDDFTTDSKYVDFDFKVKSSAMKILHQINKEDNLRYLFYVVSYLKYTPFSHKRTWISDFSKLRIKYRLPIEQNAIVSELDKIQAALDNKKEQLKKLDELIQSKFYEMFGDPVVNDKGWKVEKLGKMGTLKNGLNYSQNEEGCTIRILSVSDFKDRFKIEDVTQLSTISLSQMPSDEMLLKDGDIVFVRSNGNKKLVGRSLLVYPRNEPTSFSGFCIRFRNNSKLIDNTFLVTCLKTDSIREKLFGRGANISNLNQTMLQSLVIPCPPLSLQQTYTIYVEKVEQAKAIVNQEIAHLQELLNSRMDYYFRK